jgi:hypothetical protein
MLQQINLYNVLPRPAKPWVTKKMLFIFYSLFLIILFLKWGNLLWEKHQLVKEYEKENVLLADAQKQFKHLIAQYPTVDTTNIKNIGESLHAELINELKILSMLAKSSVFAAYMQGLAQTSTDGIWLTEISFSANEPRVALKGNAVRPQLVQAFLEQLIQQPVFANIPFKITELTQITLDKNTVFTFDISTQTLTKAKNQT